MARVDPSVRRIRAAVAAVLDGSGPIGVACSGGADSVALLDAAIAAVGGGRVVALHVDHGLQPASATAATRVAALAKRLGARAEILPVTVPAGASLEDQARRVRYAALEAAAARLGLTCILGGHTARDQAETVLLRVVRGTGPAGLAGIPASRGVHRRPLLAIPRDVIDAYVVARALPVIDDPMNADERFARVRLRGALAAENPQLEDALLRLARSATEWTEVIDALAAGITARPVAGGVAVPAATLRAAGPAVAKRALQLLAPALEAEHLEAAWQLAVGPGRSGRGIDAPGARVERAYLDLVITTAAAPPSDTRVAGPDGPYQLRPWRPGDRMRLARLRGRSRKLSDLFADARIPRRLRAGARVAIDDDGEIVWAEHLGPAYGATIVIT